MNKNVETEYRKGKPFYYTNSTPELQIPTLGFENEEDAELAVAIANFLKAKGVDIFRELTRDIEYTFRVLGVINEWSEPIKNNRQD